MADLAATDSLRCEGLGKRYGGVVALAGVSLNFPRTGITAIIGPNGAGKTTLFDVLTGFTGSDCGSCWFEATRLTGLAPHAIARLGVVRTFQETRLMFGESAMENVMLARPRRSGEGLLRAISRWSLEEEEARNRVRAREILESVGIADVALKRGGDLSFGQQRLLTMACCLAAEARILLLDEPVAGVAAAMVTRIESVLVETSRERGMVVVEHDMSTVRRIADRIICLDHGKVVADGTPAEVLDRQQTLEIYLG